MKNMPCTPLEEFDRFCRFIDGLNMNGFVENDFMCKAVQKQIRAALTEQNNAPDDGKYYLQNKHAGFLGNAPIWCGKNGKGYTAYILGAERMTKEEAEGYIKMSPDKFAMYKCSDVDKRLHLVFDSQDFKRLGTDEPCGWSSEYAQKRTMKNAPVLMTVITQQDIEDYCRDNNLKIVREK